jgi:hypothetical protein
MVDLRGAFAEAGMGAVMVIAGMMGRVPVAFIAAGSLWF